MRSRAGTLRAGIVHGSLLLATTLGHGCLTMGSARAEPPPDPGPPPVLEPSQVRGLERPAEGAGDARREAESQALFLPRELVKLIFIAGGVTATLMRDEQIVPRVEEMLSPRPGTVSVLPSLFLDTRRRASAGVQALASLRNTGFRLSAGFGGIHDLVGEARVGLALPRPLPFVISLEGLVDTQSTLDYFGVGQQPNTDPRNQFFANAATHDALYFEERERAILNLGARIGADFEWFVSSSLLRSLIEDTPGGGPDSITSVFQPGSVTGAPSVRPGACADQMKGSSCPVGTLISYTEVAVRLDTREWKTRPSPGVLLATYAGAAVGLGDNPSRFYRVGGRAAGFIPIVRHTNILSPKLVLDGTVRPGGSAPVPFTQLVGEPDFRGFDTRIDSLSMVASLDYRWSMLRYLGPRISSTWRRWGRTWAPCSRRLPASPEASASTSSRTRPSSGRR